VPEGVLETAVLAVRLKAYPDTNLELSPATLLPGFPALLFLRSLHGSALLPGCLLYGFLVLLGGPSGHASVIPGALILGSGW
jgi:hypothetical protein